MNCALQGKQIAIYFTLSISLKMKSDSVECMLGLIEYNLIFRFSDLSNNQISEAAPDAFQGLRSLNSL